MIKLYPSQIRLALNTMFGGANIARMEFIDDGFCSKLKAIIAMIDYMPPELFRVSSQLLCDYLEARASIEAICSRGSGSRFSAINGRNIVQVLFEVLASCPDEPPPLQPERLAFISDPAFADNLARDIDTVNRAIENGNWKIANVLAGSAIEAMLLYILGSVPRGDLDIYKTEALERWDLNTYASAAAGLNKITASTKAEIDICREYRNLIHPGRAVRLRASCDRGTAFAAVAALEHVIRDLS